MTHWRVLKAQQLLKENTKAHPTSGKNILIITTTLGKYFQEKLDYRKLEPSGKFASRMI